MRELEEILSSAPLRAPSDQLQPRIAGVLEDSLAGARPWYSLSVPLWACLGVAFLCGLLGYVGRDALGGRRPHTVFVIPAEGDLRRYLTGEADRSVEQTLSSVDVRVVQTAAKKL